MKKIIFVLCMLCLAASAFAADWTGATSEPENSKKINGKVFYVITSAEELAWFAAQVNGGRSVINAVLANDIRFMDDTSKTSSVNWTPIGKNSSAMFDGIFDGAGKTVYGLYSEQDRFAGIFGVTDSNAVIRNLSSQKTLIKSSIYAGGIVAWNSGTVTGCTNGGSVTAYAEDGSPIYSGGIAGWNAGMVTGCTNSGAVSSSQFYKGSYAYSYSGGIAGWNAGMVTGCTNSGAASSSRSYIGGIAGYNRGTISDCKNWGSVNGAGLVKRDSSSGKLRNSFSVADTAVYGVIYSSSGTVTNCYYDSDVLTGKSTVAPNSGLHTADMQRDQFAWILNTTNGTAENSGVWSRDSVGYPIYADSIHKPIYKIVFDDDGATTNRYTNYKGLVSFPEDPEAPEGKMFSGWYTDGGVKVKESTVFSGDQTVNAVYIDVSDVYFSIRFFNADSTLLDSQSVQYGKTPIYSGTPTLASTAQYSYTFAGWHVEPTAATENFDYYAVYTETLNAYVVRFFDYDGTVLQSSSYLYGAIPGMATAPTRKSTVAYNYTFAGWNPAVVKVSRAADYTALYDSSKVRYTVTFMNGSEVFAKVQAPYGEAAVAPNPGPAREGYKFVGWNKSFSNVTSDMTVLALFEELVYRNIVISRGDGEDETIQVEEDSLFTLPEAPKKEGHLFIGWYDADGNFLGNPGDTIKIKADIQIVAHFKALSSSSSEKSSSSMAKSSSSVGKSSSSGEKSSSSVGKSSSSGEKSSSSVGKSSSSGEKTSSSSLGEGKSSSSNEGSEAILARVPVPTWTATASGRSFRIHAAPVGKPYALFDLQGKVLAKGRIESSEMTILAPRAGSFIVRIGANTVRMNAK